jgi:hypothetical protein
MEPYNVSIFEIDCFKGNNIPEIAKCLSHTKKFSRKGFLIKALLFTEV